MTSAKVALEVVARRFSTTIEQGEDSPFAYLEFEGRKVAVEVTMLALGREVASISARPRLRFDKAVLRVVGRLQAALSDIVLDGSAIVFTMTAPIRLAAKTAADLEARIRECLSNGRDEIEDTIHGNRIRVRVLTGGPRSVSKVVGFVHNPETDSRLLLDMSQALLACLGAARKETSAESERWLIVAVDRGPTQIEAWRQVWLQLSIETGFAKILIVSAGGQVETLEP